MLSNTRSTLSRALVLVCALLHLGPALAGNDQPVLPAGDHPLDTVRFEGTWHVVANIPVRIPFFSDADAVEYTQEVTRTSDTTVKLYTRFLRAEHNMKMRDNTYKGFLVDPDTMATWDFQPLWPIKIGCTIFYVEDDYQVAMIGTPSRNWAWIMVKELPVTAEKLEALVRIAADHGFNPESFRRIPGTYIADDDA